MAREGIIAKRGGMLPGGTGNGQDVTGITGGAGYSLINMSYQHRVNNLTIKLL